MSETLTKEVLLESIKSAKEFMRKAEADFNRNNGIAEYSQALLDKYFSDQPKEVE